MIRSRHDCPPHRRASSEFGRHFCMECDVEVRPAKGGGWEEMKCTACGFPLLSARYELTEAGRAALEAA